jgi:hypothetical protein
VKNNVEFLPNYKKEREGGRREGRRKEEGKKEEGRKGGREGS